nr:GNAT family N-acetyltransferase [uncultured Dongia sp.]
MVRLDRPDAAAAHALYRANDAYFPLIGAVLLGLQDGWVYADAILSPRRFYVEHSFGFAQLFGEENAAFDATLQAYLITNKAFQAQKVRLYTPIEPGFLQGPAFAAQRAERQRFRLDPARHAPSDGTNHKIVVRDVVPAEIDRIEAAFDVVSRFWCGPADFLAHAGAVAAWHGHLPVAICYAAAAANGMAEIDVATDAAYRRQNLGRRVVDAFVTRCRGQGLQPVWDCFTNNAGSMNLCRAAGFVSVRPPYPFYTLAR